MNATSETFDQISAHVACGDYRAPVHSVTRGNGYYMEEFYILMPYITVRPNPYDHAMPVDIRATRRGTSAADANTYYGHIKINNREIKLTPDQVPTLFKVLRLAHQRTV